MQQENKNDSIQLSSRYQQYTFAKLYFRGTSRPEVFPITGGNGKNLKQLIGGGQGNRVYGTEGVACTQASQAGGQGAKTGLYMVDDPSRKKGIVDKNISPILRRESHGNVPAVVRPVITPDRLNKRQNGRRMKENGEPAFTVTAQDRHGVVISDILERKKDKLGRNRPLRYAKNLSNGTKIRRLTPKECERLQGFPDVEKYVKIKVCKQQNANGVELNFNTKNIDQDNAVQSSVLIDCVENGVEIHSQGKLLLNAKNVEKKNWCHQYIKIDDFVQMLVGINLILEKITQDGEVDYLLNEQCLIHQKNGKKLENLFGKEITQPVGAVEKDLIILKELLRSITLDRFDTENLEQKLAILSSFVIRAITGYIPSEIKSQNIFTIIIKSKVGWTYGCSDSARYKMCGNAVTVNVIKAIMLKLLK